MKTELIRPQPLPDGGCIGIVAPARWLDETALTQATAKLVARGYTVKVHPQCHLRHHHFAGTDAERAAALHEMFTDPTVDAILCARGGTGSIRLHPHLDYKLIADNPKPLSGFSDITALHYMLRTHSNLMTFHGPLAWNFATYDDDWTLDTYLGVMGNKLTNLTHPDGKAVRTGVAQGPLVGGNLSLLCTLNGTPFMPDLNGAILFIEDIDEELARLDRMLHHLAHAGWFDRISGLIIGETNTMDTLFNRSFGSSLEELFLMHIQRRGVPVITNYPCGHNRKLATFPIGGHARLEVDGSHYRLELL